MSKQNRRYYPPEFKAQALELLATGEYSVAGLERELGITPGLLNKWRRRAELSVSSVAGSAGTTPNPKAMAEQIKLLERRAARLEQERDILKKALAIFSSPNR
jgi:transposase